MTRDFKKNDGVQPVGNDVVVDLITIDDFELTCCAGSVDWELDISAAIKSWRLHSYNTADNALINHGENKSQVDAENNDIPNLTNNRTNYKYFRSRAVGLGFTEAVQGGRIAEIMEEETADAGAHYRFEYRGIKLDPFRICEIYNITSLGQGTIVKKGLRLGTSIKDRKQDLIDIRSAVDRMLEMMDEDE